MSEEKTPATDAEKPQSPSVVKSAIDTKAKSKSKLRVEFAEKPATQPVEISPTPANLPGGKSVPTHGKDFLDDAFDLFGWGD